MLTLGPIEFGKYEIPERINFGGKQDVKIHRLIGGQRVVDAMGPDEDPIRWSGRFQGENATGRARQLDALRISGAKLPLSYGSFFYLVVITHFEGDYEAFYQIPYKIECTVTDQPGADIGFSASGLDALVATDIGIASAIISALGGL